MLLRIIIIFLLAVSLNSCSKKKDNLIYEPKPKEDAYKLYNDAFSALEKNDFFFASKKFS